MVRLLVGGSDAGASLFDWMTTGTKRFLAHLRPDLSPPARSARATVRPS